MRITSLPASFVLLGFGIIAVGCDSSGNEPGTTTSTSTGGSTGTVPVGIGGASNGGGTTTSSGVQSTGGSVTSGGSKASTTSGALGGSSAGGSKATGGSKAMGGSSTGGGTSTATAGASSTLDCSAIPAMPTGGTDHCGKNDRGTMGSLAWELWSNKVSSSACITTFSTPAFSARWSDNSDFLARIGLELGTGTKTYDQYGVIKADFAYKKTGTAGGYSYIGIYGWTVSPCVEWYIIDDRWGTMPFDAYNAGAAKATVKIDGENYKIFANSTPGTGGSRCNKGETTWQQYWSIRQTARQCGTITITDHFKAWEAAGLALGGLLEAKILVETGGGTGNIEFPYANVTKSQ